MRLRPLVLASMFVCLSPAFARAEEPALAGMSADDALRQLKDGNARFVAGESTFPHLAESRRCETTEGGQHPTASILSCADSRVPPELLFDAGLGDLFIVRVAGNVAGTDEIATLEYGAGHLGTPLIVIMGHSHCDAVTAVVKHADVGPNLAKLMAPIAPAVETARVANPTAGEQRLINLSIRANVRQSMQDLLAQSAEIRELVAAGKVRVVGAVYDIHNGTVEWIAEPPSQAALLKAEGGPVAAKDDGHDAHVAAAVIKGTTARTTGPDESHGHASTDSKTPTSAHGESKSSEHGDDKPAAHGEDAHATPAAHKAEPHAAAEPAAEAHGAEEHAEVGPTLMQRQGLLLPAAFMAAGSALSGTIVYAMTGRAKAAATHAVRAATPASAAAHVESTHAAPEVTPHAEAKPAAH